MDAFAVHQYLIPSKLPPTFRFKNPKNTTIALSDYDKLVRALGNAFDGTAQPGSTLPILANEPVTVQLPGERLLPGRYQFVLRVFESGKPGTGVLRLSEPFTVTPPEVSAPPPTG